MDKKIALEAEQISKKFGNVKVLDKVNLCVYEGEVLGLIGGNGAGKSTLLKILNGLYPYSTYEGQIKIDGKVVKLTSPHDAQLKGIGFVPQETNVLESLSVAENIFVGNMLRNAKSKWFINFKEMYRNAALLMQQYNFNFDPQMKVRMLSIGSKQLLMVARALSLNPKVLILDEPTTSLTLDEVNNLIQIVNVLKEKGTSIVFVTHKMEEIMNVCDRVVILRDGKSINTYEKQDFREEIIVKDMSGREIKNLYPQRDVQVKTEILKVKGLTVTDPKIRDKNSIENVNFILREREVLGIAGLTGSGRTEILNTLFGRNPYIKGEIWMYGKEVRIRNENDAMKLGIALVTEDRKKDGLLFLSSIRNNLSINNLSNLSKWTFISHRSEQQAANNYFKLMNVKAESIETLVSMLSGGNQQKVIIGRALSRSPKILLLDEPTKGIDVGAKNEIYHIINALVEEGLSIVLVSSDLPELIAMSDRCIVMANGQVVDEFTKKEATEERVMMTATKSAHVSLGKRSM